MSEDERLRLIALDAEDLGVLSAHIQDAVMKVGDMAWLKSENRFVVAMNRFVWEKPDTDRRSRRDHQRRRAVLHFDRVETVRQTGVEQNAPDAVLELLSVRFEPSAMPSGEVRLDFAGGATISLAVEVLEAQLSDLGPAWSTPHAPRHILV